MGNNTAAFSRQRGGDGSSDSSGQTGGEDLRDFKFVVIGETGSGKTAFVNFLLNLPELMELKHKRDHGDPQAYIGWTQQHHINPRTERDGEDQSGSSTSECNDYPISGLGRPCVVIDSPGLGDTDGLAQDRLNVKNIERTILRHEYINAICFVINGRVGRATAQLLHVIANLIQILPKSIVGQMVIVFTRVDDELHLEAKTALEALGTELGHKIPNRHQFCFENPLVYHALLKAKTEQEGRSMVPAEREKLVQNFVTAMQSNNSFFSVIEDFPGVRTNVFQDLFVAKGIIEKDTLVLNETLMEIAVKQAEVANKKRELDACEDLRIHLAQKKDASSWTKWTAGDDEEHHHMNCSVCHQSCHENCCVPFATSGYTNYKLCHSFTERTKKPVRITNQVELDRLNAITEESEVSYNFVETGKFSHKDVNVRICVNEHLGGVDIIGDPFTQNPVTAPEWLPTKQSFFLGAAYLGQKKDFKVGSTYEFFDWENMLEGSKMTCSKCHCQLVCHSHAKWHWTSEQKYNPEIVALYDDLVSEEAQKSALLSKADEELDLLKQDEESCKYKLFHALTDFKMQSPASSYVRLLLKQQAFLRILLEHSSRDVTISTQERETKISMLKDEIGILQIRSDTLTGLDDAEAEALLREKEVLALKYRREITKLAATWFFEVPSCFDSMSLDDLFELKHKFSLQAHYEQIQRDSKGEGLVHRIHGTYLAKVQQLIAELPEMTLPRALESMAMDIKNCMTKTKPEQKHWHTIESTKEQLSDFANSECKGSFITCYTAEHPPIYSVVSSVFHAADRIDEDGSLSTAIKRCAHFYKGLHAEFESHPETLCKPSTVWRGVRYNFPTFTDYFAAGTKLAFYEPKSVSTNFAVARDFAGPHGTLFKITITRAFDVSHLSKYKHEQEWIVPFGSEFTVLDNTVNSDGPNVVVMEQNC